MIEAEDQHGRTLTDFVSDREMFRRWGISQAKGRIAVAQFEKAPLDGNPRFPRKDPLFSQKRYWPAVKAFLFHRYGMLRPPESTERREDRRHGPPHHHERPRDRLAQAR